jgi:hypothetical protein
MDVLLLYNTVYNVIVYLIQWVLFSVSAKPVSTTNRSKSKGRFISCTGKESTGDNFQSKTSPVQKLKAFYWGNLCMFVLEKLLVTGRGRHNTEHAQFKVTLLHPLHVQKLPTGTPPGLRL